MSKIVEKIQIKEKDRPKVRDLNRVSIIPRKKGPHKNHKKENDKHSCRKFKGED